MFTINDLYGEGWGVPFLFICVSAIVDELATSLLLYHFSIYLSQPLELADIIKQYVFGNLAK